MSGGTHSGAIHLYERARAASRNVDRTAATVLQAIALRDTDDLERAHALVAEDLYGDLSLVEVLILTNQLTLCLAQLGRFEEARESSARNVSSGRSQVAKALDHVRRINNVAVRSMLGDWSDPFAPARSSVPLLTQIDADVMDSLTGYVGVQFKGSFNDPFTQSWVFQSEDPVESATQTALVRVGCFGDWGATRNYGATLAKYRLLEGLGAIDRANASDIELLVRSGDGPSAGVSVATFRRVGPVGAAIRAGGVGVNIWNGDPRHSAGPWLCSRPLRRCSTGPRHRRR